MANLATLRLELVVKRPAVTKAEYDSVSPDGTEMHTVVQYNVARDSKGWWVGSRADGRGETYRMATLQRMLALLVEEILDEVKEFR